MLVFINERAWSLLWVTLNFALRATWRHQSLPSPLSEQQSWGLSWRDCPGISRFCQPLHAHIQDLWGKRRCAQCDSGWPSDISTIQLAITFLSQLRGCLETSRAVLYLPMFKCMPLLWLLTLIFLLTDMSLYYNKSSPYLSLLEIDCVVWRGVRNLCLRIRVTVRKFKRLKLDDKNHTYFQRRQS